MKKKTLYIANDGTEFETKEECEYYENRYKALLDNPEVIFFDKDLKPLTKCYITDDYTWRKWRKLFIEGFYINIPSVECFDLLAEAYKELLNGQHWIPADNSKIGL